MAISANTVWEVRTTGNDLNGGGFVTGSAGADYSQQAAAQYTFADMASSNGTTSPAVVTSASHSFVAADVGSLMQITAGTSWTTGFYQIVSVSAGAATLDKGCGSTATLSGGTYAVGGALASPGKAASGFVMGNTLWMATGTYTLTNSTANTAGGPVNITANSNIGVMALVKGYDVVRGDATGNQPVISAGTQTSVTLVTLSGLYTRLENIKVDGKSNASVTGINLSNQTLSLYNCKAMNCSNYGIQVAGSNIIENCEVFGCSNTFAMYTQSPVLNCYFHNNTGSNGLVAVNAAVINCLSVNNTGRGIFLSNLGQAINCTAYGNTGSGFFTDVSDQRAMLFLNCLSVSNGEYGFDSISDHHVIYRNCAAYNNTSGAIQYANAINNFAFLTALPFTNAAGGDFSLNNLAGGGALCRAGGLLGPFPGLSSTTGYQDIGAVQHKDPLKIRGRLGDGR